MSTPPNNSADINTSSSKYDDVDDIRSKVNNQESVYTPTNMFAYQVQPQNNTVPTKTVQPITSDKPKPSGIKKYLILVVVIACVIFVVIVHFIKSYQSSQSSRPTLPAAKEKMNEPYINSPTLSNENYLSKAEKNVVKWGTYSSIDNNDFKKSMLKEAPTEDLLWGLAHVRP